MVRLLASAGPAQRASPTQPYLLDTGRVLRYTSALNSTRI